MGYVSYGLGAAISLPPCLIGGHRLVSDTKLFSISDPRVEISGVLVMVRRSSILSRLEVLLTGSIFLFSCDSGIWLVHAYDVQTEMLTITVNEGNGKLVVKLYAA